MVRFEAVNCGNVWDIVRLTVNEEQSGFVASNSESIIEAYAASASGGTALPFGIYDGDTPVGFIMFGYGSSGDTDDPPIAHGNYCIWRFMIDRQYQRRGYGRAALKAAIAYVKSRPCGDAEYCWLSYEPENAAARALYESEGFRENGEICGEETVMALRL